MQVDDPHPTLPTSWEEANEQLLRDADSATIATLLERCLRADESEGDKVQAVSGVPRVELQRALFGELDASPSVAAFSLRDTVRSEKMLRERALRNGDDAPTLKEIRARTRKNAKHVSAMQHAQ